MTDRDTTPDEPGLDEGHTDEYPTVASGLDAPSEFESALPFEDDADDEWPIRGPARGIRLGIPAALLVAALLVAGGFWGGAVVQKRHGGSTSAGGRSAAGFAARLRGALGATGAAGATGATGATGSGGFPGFGGSTSAAAGTISVVDGNTLYVLTATDSLVKVTLDSTTTVTRNAKSQAIDLRPGDTVVIQGATSPSGDVTASSVSATAPGVTSSSGFGRGLGLGSAGTTTTTSGGSDG